MEPAKAQVRFYAIQVLGMVGELLDTLNTLSPGESVVNIDHIIHRENGNDTFGYRIIIERHNDFLSQPSI